MIRNIIKEADNIAELRKKHENGLCWVVGDTHGEARTLQHLMETIQFDPEKDRVYFLGDYNCGGDPHTLLKYLSLYFQPDYSLPGFHLIRGNHERELSPMYPLENMPDFMVIRGNVMNYYLVHAGMVSSAFNLVNDDMASEPKKKYFAYRLTEECAGYDAPLRQITWSRRGLYSQNSKWKKWPDEYNLYKNKACIIHGHTPYSFFNVKMHSFYGDKSLFWQKQHIWFSEDLQSFDIDSNIKGVSNVGENYRGLSCICLDVLEEIARANNCFLDIESIINAENFVFTADYEYSYCSVSDDNLPFLIHAAPEMKTIHINANGMLYLKN